MDSSSDEEGCKNQSPDKFVADAGWLHTAFATTFETLVSEPQVVAKPSLFGAGSSAGVLPQGKAGGAAGPHLQAGVTKPLPAVQQPTGVIWPGDRLGFRRKQGAFTFGESASQVAGAAPIRQRFQFSTPQRPQGLAQLPLKAPGPSGLDWSVSYGFERPNPPANLNEFSHHDFCSGADGIPRPSVKGVDEAEGSTCTVPALSNKRKGSMLAEDRDPVPERTGVHVSGRCSADERVRVVPYEAEDEPDECSPSRTCRDGTFREESHAQHPLYGTNQDLEQSEAGRPDADHSQRRVRQRTKDVRSPPPLPSMQKSGSYMPPVPLQQAPMLFAPYGEVGGWRIWYCMQPVSSGVTTLPPVLPTSSGSQQSAVFNPPMPAIPQGLPGLPVPAPMMPAMHAMPPYGAAASVSAWNHPFPTVMVGVNNPLAAPTPLPFPILPGMPQAACQPMPYPVQLFPAAQPHAWQYGAASSMTGFYPQMPHVMGPPPSMVPDQYVSHFAASGMPLQSHMLREASIYGWEQDSPERTCSP
eukprot:jgi/Chlat1/2849/Chrsp194S02998